MSAPSHLVLTVLLSAVGLLAAGPLQAQAPPLPPLVLDDFESEEPNHLPSRWKYITQNGEVLSVAQVVGPGQKAYVVREGRRQFLRLFTEDEALRITMTNGDEFDWSLEERPRLSWKWRANTLPEGASERDRNDTGGAVYVTFDTDWLGRPKSIKYTYSSTLPVGSVVSFGRRLKVIVVASGRNGTGTWKHVERDVIRDYRWVFEEEPPEEPLSITLWSDADNTGSVAEVDIDDLELLPPES